MKVIISLYVPEFNFNITNKVCDWESSPEISNSKLMSIVEKYDEKAISVCCIKQPLRIHNFVSTY